MKFTEVINLLQQGKVVRRSDWRNVVVFKQVPATIEGMQSVPADAKELILRTAGQISYTNQCLVYNVITGQADSWVPSMTDIFSDDWCEVDI